MNNGAIADNCRILDEVTDEVWQRNLDVNLSGPFKACRAALPGYAATATHRRPRCCARRSIPSRWLMKFATAWSRGLHRASSSIMVSLSMWPRMELPMRPFGLSLPEIFVTGSHPDIVARAAAKESKVFMSFGHRGLKPALAFRSLLAECWQKGGGDPGRTKVAVQRYVFVTDNAAEAQHAAACVGNLARAAVNRTSEVPSKDGSFLRLMPLNDEPPLDDFLDNAIIGPASRCVEKLHGEIEALRPSHLSCFMGFAGIGREQTLASMERFGYDVLPKLRPHVIISDAA